MSNHGTRSISLLPEEKLLQKVRTKRQFKALVRLAYANRYWLEDEGGDELGDNVKKNVRLLTRRRGKRTLNFQEKCLFCKPPECRTDEDKVILNRVIGALKCFKSFGPEIRDQIARVIKFVYYGPNRVIVRQGHESLAGYFIITGQVSVHYTENDPILNRPVTEKIGVLEAGSMFGEISLLHDTPRSNTLITQKDCELLMLNKEDYINVLRETVMSKWDEIKCAMARFRYFDHLSGRALTDTCVRAKIKRFAPDETILGDGQGQSGFVHFILKGSCKVIEHLLVSVRQKHNGNHYSLYIPPPEEEVDFYTRKSLSNATSRSKAASMVKSKAMLKKSSKPVLSRSTTSRLRLIPELEKLQMQSSSAISITSERKPSEASAARVLVLYPHDGRRSQTDLPDNVETHFMQVCHFTELACFALGEYMKHRRIIAVTNMECLLIPKYHLMILHNKGNIWGRIEQFLNKHIPTTEKVFKEFLLQEKWRRYRKKVVEDIFKEKILFNDNNINNVPYYIRMNEDLDY